METITYTDAPAAVASNWVAGIDALLFVFILAPLSPPALSVFGVRAQIRRASGSPRRGRRKAPQRNWCLTPITKREPTAIFGRVFKTRKYKLIKHVRTKLLRDFQETDAKHCSTLETRPNEAPLFRPAGRERGGGDRVGPKKETNTFLSTLTTHFDSTACADMDCHVDVSRVAATEAALAMTRVFR